MSVIQHNSDSRLTNLSGTIERTISSSSSSSSQGAVSSGQKNSSISPLDLTESATKNVAANAESEPLNTKQLEKVAQQLQDFVGDLNRNLEFSVDKDSGRDVIKVFDKGSGDLLKQYPSEEVLTLVSKLSEMVGGFIDAKV